MIAQMRDVEGCIFCDIINGRGQGYWIYEDQRVAALLSLEGHPLVVPKRHFKDVFELDDMHAAEIMKAALRVARATKTTMGCDGISLVQSNGASAGQDVFHFHLHIKPRFIGDDVTMTWDTREIDDAVRNDTCNAISRHLRKSP